MHAALVLLLAESGRLGLRSRAGLTMTVTPNAAVGQRVTGADEALRALIQQGVLRETGAGLAAHLVVDHDAMVTARRNLLAMDADVVALLQRAGDRWAAFASTAAKYAPRPTASPSEVVASATA